MLFRYDLPEIKRNIINSDFFTIEIEIYIIKFVGFINQKLSPIKPYEYGSVW